MAEKCELLVHSDSHFLYTFPGNSHNTLEVVAHTPANVLAGLQVIGIVQFYTHLQIILFPHATPVGEIFKKTTDRPAEIRPLLKKGWILLLKRLYVIIADEIALWSRMD